MLLTTIFVMYFDKNHIFDKIHFVMYFGISKRLVKEVLYAQQGHIYLIKKV